MSSVFVEVGQCGNQIGHCLYKRVLSQLNSDSSHVFCHLDEKLRSVNIDSEPKVVNRILKETKTGIFRESNAIIGKRGRGSNWALGYNGLKYSKEDHILSDAMEAHRKEAERCDSFSGTVMIHSSSGGTGAGLGSRLCEAVRDEYPMAYIMSVIVVPHSSGESPLQHYNSLLCLAWLQRYSDGIIWFDNDEIMNYMLKTSRAPSGGSANVSLDNMNHFIANALAGTLLPVDTLTPASGFSNGMEPWELIRSVCPMPSTKFIHLNHIARSKCSWNDILKNSNTMLQKRGTDGCKFSSLANVIVARGDTASFPSQIKTMEEIIKKNYNIVKWNPYPCDFWIGKDSTYKKSHTSSLTIASNYSSVTDVIQRILNRSSDMYNAGAFLHWYWRYGCEKEDFEGAFDTVEDIVVSYAESVTH